MPSINIFDSIAVSEQADVGNFVKMVGGQFIKDNARYRFVGGNRHDMAISFYSQARLDELFGAYQTAHTGPIRLWAFDVNTTGPFHHLVYPVGTNLLTDGDLEAGGGAWTLGTGFTISTNQPRGGVNSVKQVTGGGNFQTVKSPSFAVTPNTSYVWTFWYAMNHTGGFEPVIRVWNADTNTQILDGGFLGTGDTSLVYKQKQVVFNSGAATNVQVLIQAFGGNVTAYYDDFNVCLTGVPTLEPIESSFVQMDLVMDEARKKGLKLIPVFLPGTEDQPTSFNAKYNFMTWVNALYPGANLGYSYGTLTFFTDSRIEALIKQTMDDWFNRKNTINGRMYISDDTIFSWEIANELRASNFGPNDNTSSSYVLNLVSGPGGWADRLTTYVRSKDPNHMIAFTASEHAILNVNGDYVWNGTYYGVDYGFTSALPNVSYLSVHMYPSENNGGEIHTYGIHLGYSSPSNPQPTEAGYIAQIQDFVAVAKSNGKAIIIDEFGYVYYEAASNAITTQYPRLKIFETTLRALFAAGGDGMLVWQLASSDADARGLFYGVNITGTWDGNTTNLNTNDIPLSNLFYALNTDGTFVPLANAYVNDLVRISEFEFSQLNVYLLAFIDLITVAESVEEINKELGIAYNSIGDEPRVSDSATPSKVNNVNLSQIILGPHLS